MDRVHGYSDGEWDLVSRFIEEPQKAVRADAEDVPAQFKPVLEYLADNLLSSKDARIGKAVASAGLKGNYSTRFRKVIGMGPKEYIDHHRARLAQSILQNTDAFVGTVATTLGFDDSTAFAKWYERVVGHLPSEERNIPGRVTAPLDPRLSDSTEVAIGDTAPLDLAGFWSDVSRLTTRLDIRNYLVAHGEEIGIDHFRFLLDKSTYVGRMDRERGAELAGAALDCVRVIEIWQDVEMPAEKILAYAFLGNARRRNFDIKGAFECFKVIDEGMPNGPMEDQELYCRVNAIRATLFWWAGKSSSALALIQGILPELRRHCTPEFLTRTILVAADIHDSLGRTGKAIPLLCEALDMVELITDPYVTFTARYNLTNLYARSSNGPRALSSLEKVLKLYKNVEDQVPAAHVHYLKGCVERICCEFDHAKISLLKAQKGFLDRKEDFHAAHTAMQLSLLYLDTDDPEEAVNVLMPAVPVISQCGIHQESAAAFAVLQESVSSGVVKGPILKQASEHLERIRKDPGFQFRKK